MHFNFLEKTDRKDSLKSKIYKDLLKGVFISFFLGYIIYISLHYYFNFNLEDIIMESAFYILMAITILIIMEVILLKSVQKHVVDKLDSMGQELNEVKSGNLKKRLTIFDDDEIGRRADFINSLLDELEKLIENEKKYSLVDPLTNCYNRRALSFDVAPLVNKAKRDNSSFAMALFDLDDFKKVNDQYGHKIGDDVLVSFSKILKDIIRSNDTLYRIGGEEFLLVMADINVRDTKKLLERIRKKVPYGIKKSVEAIESNITFSCGFVSSKKYNLKDDKLIEKMIVDADKLTYEAKNNGKDQIVY